MKKHMDNLISLIIPLICKLGIILTFESRLNNMRKQMQIIPKP